MREALVRCGRAPLSICERYDWLNPLPTSFLSAMASSCCVISRSSPRRVASTKRRYRSFSPSFILQLAIIILQYVMSRNGFGLLSIDWGDPNDFLIAVSLVIGVRSAFRWDGGAGIIWEIVLGGCLYFFAAM